MENIKNEIALKIASVTKEKIVSEADKAMEKKIISEIDRITDKLAVEVFRECIENIVGKKSLIDTPILDNNIKDAPSNKPEVKLASGKLPTAQIGFDRKKIIEAVKNLNEVKPELKDKMKELFSKNTFGSSSVKDIPDNKLPDFICFLREQGADI